jgi:hypothetical protein
MDRNLAIDLFLYGFILLGHRVQAAIASSVLGAVALGGIFLCALAVLGMRGYRMGVNSYVLKPVGASALADILGAIGTHWLQHSKVPDLKAFPA